MMWPLAACSNNPHAEVKGREDPRPLSHRFPPAALGALCTPAMAGARVPRPAGLPPAAARDMVVALQHTLASWH